MKESIFLISWIFFTEWHFNHIQNKSINSMLFEDIVTDLSNFMNSRLLEKRDEMYFWLIIHK